MQPVREARRPHTGFDSLRPICRHSRSLSARDYEQAGEAGVKGCLRIAVPIIILVVIAIYSAFPHPTSNQTVLKAIAAESRQLLVSYPTEQYVSVPEEKWPPTIASLKPFMVTVYPGMVHIGTKPFFDGGWGYGFISDKEPVMQPCWSELGYGVYWHGPC